VGFAITVNRASSSSQRVPGSVARSVIVSEPAHSGYGTVTVASLAISSIVTINSVLVAVHTIWSGVLSISET